MILLFACVASDDTTTRPPRQGPPGPDDTEEIEDQREPPEDTGPGDTGDTGEPIEPDPSGQEACFPGADESWTTCLEVVDWDDAWGSDYDYPDPYNGSSQYLKPLRFIDLSAADPDLALAPNFVVDEFMQEWKGRFAIYQPHAVARMQQIRDRVGGAVTVNSGYRNVSYNASVGGATSALATSATTIPTSTVTGGTIRSRPRSSSPDAAPLSIRPPSSARSSSSERCSGRQQRAGTRVSPCASGPPSTRTDGSWRRLRRASSGRRQRPSPSRSWSAGSWC